VPRNLGLEDAIPLGLPKGFARDQFFVAYATKGRPALRADRAGFFGVERAQLPAGVAPCQAVASAKVGALPPAACLRQGFGKAGRPAQQRLRRSVVPQRAARSLRQHFQMPGIAAVDALEVPRARDDFRVRLSRANTDPQGDSLFTKGPTDVLDHATGEITIGSKLGIDATKKLPGEGFKRPWPPLIKMDESVRKKINALINGNR